MSLEWAASLIKWIRKSINWYEVIFLQITIQKEHSNNLTKLDSTKHIQVRTCGQCCFIAQKTKFSIKDILSKCDQIRMKLQI